MTLKKSLKSLKKQTKLSGYEQDEIEANKLQRSDEQKTKCLDTWIYSVGLGASALQQSNLGEYEQLSLWKSTPTRETSCDRTSQEYQFTQTSETTIQSQESLKSSQWDGRVREHQTRELGQDSNIQLLLFGERDLDVSLKPNPSSVLWNNLKELSDGDFELFLGDSLWQDTVSRLKQSRQQAKALGNKDSDYLSFPTLTSNESSTSRPAGQTKCDRWFKDKGLIKSGYQLGTQAIAMIMGFPMDWFDCLSPTERQEESKVDISQEEQSPQDKQQSPSAESSTSTVLLGGEKKLLEHKRGERSSQDRELSIPCLVKQPKQPEVKGVIRKDSGDRFTVYIPDSDSTITVSKLFVYPDFSNSVGQIEKNPSKDLSPSKNIQRKTRRRKGEGSGSIYYRTVTRNGKDYQQAYYHWVEGGKKRSLYIPKKLLDRVREAEGRKLPINDILILLGEKQINPSKIESKSKNQRRRGEGSGSIHCKPIKRSGKEYKQYWYHYELWSKGDRLTKKSRYIPKRLLAQVEKMNNEKTPVGEILKVLRNRSKRKKC